VLDELIACHVGNLPTRPLRVTDSQPNRRIGN
jgi:hypothetical protein